MYNLIILRFIDSNKVDPWSEIFFSHIFFDFLKNKVFNIEEIVHNCKFCNPTTYWA